MHYGQKLFKKTYNEIFLRRVATFLKFVIQELLKKAYYYNSSIRLRRFKKS